MVDSFNPAVTVTRPTQANADNKDQIHVQLHQQLPDAIGELRTGLSTAISQLNTELAGKVASSGFTEAAQDATAAMFRAGSNVTIAYDDAANTFTINAVATGGISDPEAIRDTIGGALIGGTGVQVIVDDAADTITLSVAGIPTSAITTGIFAPARLGSGTPTSGTVLTGDGAWTTAGKSLVGLGNVDNTSDANKPVSTATQTALNAKVSTTDITPATDVVTTSSLATSLAAYTTTANLSTVTASKQDVLDLSARLTTLEQNAGVVARPARPGTSVQPAFWLRGDKIAQTSGTIIAWPDEIAALAYSVPSGRALPTYSATAVKGKPGAVFTKSAVSGLFYAMPIKAGEPGVTIFVVYQPTVAGAGNGLFQATDSAAVAATLNASVYHSSGNAHVTGVQGNTQGNAFSTTTLAANAAGIGRSVIAGSAGATKTLLSSLSGSTETGATSNTQAFSTAASAGFTLAGAGTGGGDVNIAEVIIFNSALSTADKRTWTQYLATTYGIADGGN